MKKLLITTLALAATSAFAQTAMVGQSSQTSSGAQSGSMAIGGGAVNATIGGNTNRNTARGGAGGNGQGGAATSNVTVNLAGTSADPSSANAADPTRSATANAQTPNQQPSGTLRESVQTVGSPGSMSYGVSFSQYNCANTAGVGAGFMGGAFQIGVGKESDPCNARANAAALFSIAQTLATSNAQLSAQLYHAAILLIGNSTSETKQALAAAGVSDWNPAPVATPTPAIVPPAPTGTAPATDTEGKALIPKQDTLTSKQPNAPIPTSDSDVIVGEPIVVYKETTSDGKPIPIPLTVSPENATPEDIDAIKKKMFVPSADQSAAK